VSNEQQQPKQIMTYSNAKQSDQQQHEEQPAAKQGEQQPTTM
jgi:hypothetical protein